eukprot:CFRG3364T1
MPHAQQRKCKYAFDYPLPQFSDDEQDDKDRDGKRHKRHPELLVQYDSVIEKHAASAKLVADYVDSTSMGYIQNLDPDNEVDKNCEVAQACLKPRRTTTSGKARGCGRGFKDARERGRINNIRNVKNQNRSGQGKAKSNDLDFDALLRAHGNGKCSREREKGKQSNECKLISQTDSDTNIGVDSIIVDKLSNSASAWKKSNEDNAMELCTNNTNSDNMIEIKPNSGCKRMPTFPGTNARDASATTHQTSTRSKRGRSRVTKSGSATRGRATKQKASKQKQSKAGSFSGLSALLQSNEDTVDDVLYDGLQGVAMQERKRKGEAEEAKEAREREARRSKKACTMWTNGFCKHGDDCLFSHAGEQNVQKPSVPITKTIHCTFYAQSRCIHGDDCKFSHDFKPPEQIHACRFKKTNACTEGANCVYSHDLKLFPCVYHFGVPGGCRFEESTSGCQYSHDVACKDKPEVQSFYHGNLKRVLERMQHTSENEPVSTSPSRELLNSISQQSPSISEDATNHEPPGPAVSLSIPSSPKSSANVRLQRTAQETALLDDYFPSA